MPKMKKEMNTTPMKMKDNIPFGLGNDLVEIHRIAKSIETHQDHFLHRIFTQKERDYCLQFQDATTHFAGRFSAKEAIAKALGTGIGSELSWHDLEILPDSMGKPIVHLSEQANKRFQNPTILLSISHTKDLVSTIAI